MVNIEELSAKELYELARKKEQEEARLAQMQQQLDELKAQREELIKKHQEELAYTDKQLEELTRQRKELIAAHQKALSELDSELGKLKDARDTKREESAAANRAAEKAQEKPQPKAAPATPPKPQQKAEKRPPPQQEPSIEDVDESDLDLDIGIDFDDEDEAEGEKAAQGSGRKASSEDQLDELMGHIQKIMKGRSYISEGLMKEKLAMANFRPSNLSKMLETLVRQTKLVRRSGGNYVLGRGAKKRG